MEYHGEHDRRTEQEKHRPPLEESLNNRGSYFLFPFDTLLSSTYPPPLLCPLAW